MYFEYCGRKTFYECKENRPCASFFSLRYYIVIIIINVKNLHIGFAAVVSCVHMLLSRSPNNSM